LQKSFSLIDGTGKMPIPQELQHIPCICGTQCKLSPV